MSWENLDAALAANKKLYELGYAAGLTDAATAVSAMAANGDDNFSDWQRKAIALIMEQE